LSIGGREMTSERESWGQFFWMWVLPEAIWIWVKWKFAIDRFWHETG